MICRPVCKHSLPGLASAAVSQSMLQQHAKLSPGTSAMHHACAASPGSAVQIRATAGYAGGAGCQLLQPRLSRLFFQWLGCYAVINEQPRLELASVQAAGESLAPQLRLAAWAHIHRVLGAVEAEGAGRTQPQAQAAQGATRQPRAQPRTLDGARYCHGAAVSAVVVLRRH